MDIQMHHDAARRMTSKHNLVFMKNNYFNYDNNGLLKSPKGIASLVASPSFSKVMLQSRYNGTAPYFTASGQLDFSRDTSGLITLLSGDKELGAAYDPDLQISSINHILPQPFAEGYTYDDNGNRLTSLTNTFIYDDLNRLTESTINDYTYDVDGNLTMEKNKLTSETKKYYYDSENRMIKYEHLASDIAPIDITATYKYDIFGRRLQKNVNGAITNFFWENDTMTYELDENYQPIRKYLTGISGIPRGDSITRCLAEPRHSDAMDDYEGHLEYSEITDWSHIFYPEYNQPWYSYMKDQVGTIYKVYDAQTRSVADSRAYDSFGNLVNQSGTTKTPLGFQGKYYDAESGLNYFYNRYYNPAIGRFATEDPLGTNLNIIAEDSINLKNESNLYKFVKNDGINKTDPYGLFISDLPRYMCGVSIMKYYYSKMIKKNWIGADAYYHCMGSCMTSKICGPDVSFTLGQLREITDWLRGKGYEERDMKNNAVGISCPHKKPCHERCKPLAPNGMSFD